MRTAQVVLLLVVLGPAADARQAASPREIPLEAFAQLPTMMEASISPDGSHLAYIRPVNGRGHLVIQTLEIDGTSPVVMPPAETTDFSWLHWGNDDRLVFAVSAQRKRGSVETVETRLMAINEDGSDSAYIIEPSRGKRTGSNMRHDFAPAQIQDNVINWLPDEPDFILVSLD